MTLVDLLWVTPDAEKKIMFMARVSSAKRDVDSPGLLKYLIKHGHWSPLEMANMCVEIVCTRAISRQIIRHRSFSYQEYSQRYAKVKTKFIISQARRQDVKNRQNSIDDVSEEITKEWANKQDKLNQLINDDYEWALENGIAKECARAILPEGNTLTTVCMNGTIRSWVHYLQLRCANGTQQEHIEVADKIKEIFKTQFPIISKAMDF